MCLFYWGSSAGVAGVDGLDRGVSVTLKARNGHTVDET